MNKMKLKLLVVGILLLGVQGISALDPFNPENVEGFVKAVVSQANTLEKEGRREFLGRPLNDTDVKAFFTKEAKQEAPATIDSFFGKGYPWVVADDYPVLTPAALVVGYGNAEQIQNIFDGFTPQELNSRDFCAKPEGAIYTLAHMAVDPTLKGILASTDFNYNSEKVLGNILQLVRIGVELNEVPEGVVVNLENNFDPVIVATGIAGALDKPKYSIRSLLLVLGANPAHAHGTAYGLHPYLDPSQYDTGVIMRNSFNFRENQALMVEAFIRVMDFNQHLVRPTDKDQEDVAISPRALLNQLVKNSEECKRRAEEAQRVAQMFAGEI